MKKRDAKSISSIDNQKELLLLLKTKKRCNLDKKEICVNNDIEYETKPKGIEDSRFTERSLTQPEINYYKEDSFGRHFEIQLDEEYINHLTSRKHDGCKKNENCIWYYNSFVTDQLQRKAPFISSEDDILLDYLTEKLKKLFVPHNDTNLKLNACQKLTDFQKRLFCLLRDYKDLYYSDRNLQNGEEVRFIYCLHSLNHILKTKNKILKNNVKYKDRHNKIDCEYRDQGFTRPKVLILVPFRDSALRIVNTFTELYVCNESDNVVNKQRFYNEFSKTVNKPILPRPLDYELLFTGNTDDNFKLGIKITRNSIKIYSEFSKSDVIIASPLGIRMLYENYNAHAFSFLSSIEVLILDQADVFLMQNWDHVLFLMSHLHLQPQFSEDIDFSRVRLWCLNGWYKFYRQTIILSSVSALEIKSLLKYCMNYEGCIFVESSINQGSISNIIVHIPQTFQRLNSTSVINSSEERFIFFINEILGHYRNSMMHNIMIFIPSYFDFVRLRNYFKKEEISFTHICEYTKNVKVSRSRTLFFNGSRQFMLYTERFHFYRRYSIKSIQHLIFYSPPLYSHFYSELCNMLQESLQNRNLGTNISKTCLLLYSYFDFPRLKGILGSKRLESMISNAKPINVYYTGK